jgi:cytochrome c biogenesis protein CcmG/thiol:disulfide interchange protein DsbE
MSALRFMPLVILAVLLALVAVPLWKGGAPKPPDVMTGKPVPAGEIAGIAPALLREGRVIVNFFASWCAPCAEEQPLLAHIAAEARVPVVGIAYKDDPQAIIDWLTAHGNPFAAVGYDAAGAAAINWGVYGVPETFLIEGGVIRWRHVGPLTVDVYRRDLAPRLSAAERTK